MRKTKILMFLLVVLATISCSKKVSIVSVHFFEKRQGQELSLGSSQDSKFFYYDVGNLLPQESQYESVLDSFVCNKYCAQNGFSRGTNIYFSNTRRTDKWYSKMYDVPYDNYYYPDAIRRYRWVKLNNRIYGEKEYYYPGGDRFYKIERFDCNCGIIGNKQSRYLKLNWPHDFFFPLNLK